MPSISITEDDLMFKFLEWGQVTHAVGNNHGGGIISGVVGYTANSPLSEP